MALNASTLFARYWQNARTKFRRRRQPSYHLLGISNYAIASGRISAPQTEPWLTDCGKQQRYWPELRQKLSCSGLLPTKSQHRISRMPAPRLSPRHLKTTTLGYWTAI